MQQDKDAKSVMLLVTSSQGHDRRLKASEYRVSNGVQPINGWQIAAVHVS